MKHAINTCDNYLRYVAAIGFGGYGSNALKYILPLKIKNMSVIAGGRFSMPQATHIEVYDLEQIDNIVEKYSNVKVCFIFAGLGGNSCSKIPAFCYKLKCYGVRIILILTSPFGFEGSKRIEVANEVLVNLNKITDNIFIFNNADELKSASPQLKLSEIFNEQFHKAYEIVKNIIQEFNNKNYL